MWTQRLLKEMWYNAFPGKSSNYTERIGKMKFPYFSSKNILLFMKLDENVHLIYFMSYVSHNSGNKIFFSFTYIKCYFKLFYWID